MKRIQLLAVLLIVLYTSCSTYDPAQDIDEINGGVDEFVDRFSKRHEATAERNLKLTAASDRQPVQQ